MSIRTSTEGRAPVRETLPPPKPAAAPPPPPREPGEPSPFARILHGIGREAQKGEAMMKETIKMSQAGKDLAPTELIALQAGVYRYSEAIDLGAKLVDRASTGVKTVITGQ